MELITVLLLAVGLAMDAFAVSICKGLSTKNVRREHMVVTGLYFGGFQALMPLAGYLLGSRFQSMIQRVDHWIAFVLLALIGANMVRESQGEAEHLDDSFTPGTMLPLAVATSIDALAVGVTFAFLNVRIIPAAALIGVTTFALSAIGMRLGNVFGARYQARAELAGGIVLILMGVKILLEHTGILG